jgi:hypothetical protein
MCRGRAYSLECLLWAVPKRKLEIPIRAHPIADIALLLKYIGGFADFRDGRTKRCRCFQQGAAEYRHVPGMNLQRIPTCKNVLAFPPRGHNADACIGAGKIWLKRACIVPARPGEIKAMPSLPSTSSWITPPLIGLLLATVGCALVPAVEGTSLSKRRVSAART